MTLIVVTKADKGYKVFVNWVQYGVTYHHLDLANNEATKLKTTHYPKARLILLVEDIPDCSS